jgi:hypothetical protein
LTEQNFYKQNTTAYGFRAQCKKCCDAFHMSRYHSEPALKNLRKKYKEQTTEGVYVIINTKHKTVYVGESKQIEWRWQQHRSNLKHGYHPSLELLKDWGLFGSASFEFIVSYKMKNSTKDKRLLKEEQTILEYEKRGYKVYNKRKKCTKII